MCVPHPRAPMTPLFSPIPLFFPFPPLSSGLSRSLPFPLSSAAFAFSPLLFAPPRVFFASPHPPMAFCTHPPSPRLPSLHPQAMWGLAPTGAPPCPHHHLVTSGGEKSPFLPQNPSQPPPLWDTGGSAPGPTHSPPPQDHRHLPQSPFPWPGACPGTLQIPPAPAFSPSPLSPGTPHRPGQPPRFFLEAKTP